MDEEVEEQIWGMGVQCSCSLVGAGGGGLKDVLTRQRCF